MKFDKKKLIIVLIILIIIVVISLIFIIKGKNSFKNKLIGSWTTDGKTVYEFKKNNIGFLKVSLAEYKFKYEIDDKTVFIDFDNERSEDVKYTYKLEGDKLTLKSKNGEFNFTKKTN